MLLKKILISMLLIFIFSLKADAIKVGLQTNEKEIKIASSVSAEIYDAFRDKLLYEIQPMKVYEFKSKGNEIAIVLNRKTIGLGTNQILIKTKTPGFLCSKRAWYRGNFIITIWGAQGATLVNDVPLEDY